MRRHAGREARLSDRRLPAPRRRIRVHIHACCEYAAFVDLMNSLWRFFAETQRRLLRSSVESKEVPENSNMEEAITEARRGHWPMQRAKKAGAAWRLLATLADVLRR
ncbi:hypothetical protein SORBI_3001G342101 [Sorghum bicolor]|uniref:Uncharacterized protein n=1 Tax=Sorghum bicolor TaxID=4558 RepID=A0A1Z5S900_SORBI|nr:hypothetical protein SORBI_3001G342101 [Sorghum bicolor]